MIIQTELLSGAGNTFHIAYKQATELFKFNDSRALMKKISNEICMRHKADGFIFLEEDAGLGADYRWYFFNNDGSDAEMCGNATRCVGFFIKNKIQNKKPSWVLQTVAGPIEIFSAENDEFKVIMSPIKKENSELGFYCDTGVPHLVLKGPENLFFQLNENLKNRSRELRFHSSFAPRGSNITYVEFESEKNKIKAVSYERGVEDFTAACGTGAMAAALYNLTMRGQTETFVEMPGGVLKMNLENLNQPTMTGPAILLGSYQNEINI